MKKWFKECPFCANEIKEKAIKCQYCWEFLNTDATEKIQKDNSKDNLTKNKKTSNKETEKDIIYIDLSSEDIQETEEEEFKEDNNEEEFINTEDEANIEDTNTNNKINATEEIKELEKLLSLRENRLEKICDYIIHICDRVLLASLLLIYCAWFFNTTLEEIFKTTSYVILLTCIIVISIACPISIYKKTKRYMEYTNTTWTWWAFCYWIPIINAYSPKRILTSIYERLNITFKPSTYCSHSKTETLSVSITIYFFLLVVILLWFYSWFSSIFYCIGSFYFFHFLLLRYYGSEVFWIETWIENRIKELKWEDENT